jgi:hypothetical protein
LGGGLGAQGLELTSDGHYFVLAIVPPPDYSPSSVSTTTTRTFVQDAPGADGGPGGAPVTGTYQVVDASATLGPGTYEIRLQPSTGGVYLAQVLMLGSPVKMRFVFSTGPSSEDFAPAFPLTFRAGVCNYGQLGPAYTPASNADSAAHVEGSWIWCAGPGPIAPDGQESVVGFEFPGDGTWHALLEDASGNVARGTASGDDGTVEISEENLNLGGELSPNFAISACEPVISLGFVIPFIAEQGSILQRSPTNY